MLKRRRIQFPDDSSELDLSSRHFDDEQEEVELVDVTDPSKVKKLLLNDARIGPKNTQKLFEALEKYNFGILCANNSQIANLDSHLANNSTWTNIKIIYLNNSGLNDEAIIKIAQNDSWSALMVLRLSGNLIGNEGAIALGKNTHWKNLRLLDLSHNRIGRDGAIGLAGNTAWSELKELHLQHNMFDDESSFALVRNSSWGKLEKLLLEGNRIRSARELVFDLNSQISHEFSKELEEIKENDTEHFINEKEAQFKKYFEQILTDCRDERKEELLKIWDNREKFGKINISASGIQDFNEAGHLIWSPTLEVLNLGGCTINDQGARYISNNMSWRNLKHIDLSRTKLSDNGAVLIGKNTFWTNLRSLDLSSNLIGDEGCSSLAENSTWKLLQSLNLAQNAITDKGVLSFSQNKDWTQMEDINFNKNQIRTIQAVTSLARNKSWEALKLIHVEFNEFHHEGLIPFLENHDPTALPVIKIDWLMQVRCLNAKYYQKFREIKDRADFELIINELDESFQKEIEKIPAYSSQRETVLHYRRYQVIDLEFLEGEGFNLENAYLLWFPKARKLDLAFSNQNSSKFKIVPLLATLSKHLLSWINLEELYLDNNDLTDEHLSLLEFCPPKLRKLSLRWNLITDAGALILTKNENLKNLEVLDLRGNKIRKYKAAITLMKNPNWKKFVTLYLSSEGWAREKVKAIQSFGKQNGIQYYDHYDYY